MSMIKSLVEEMFQQNVAKSINSDVFKRQYVQQKAEPKKTIPFFDVKIYSLSNMIAIVDRARAQERLKVLAEVQAATPKPLGVANVVGNIKVAGTKQEVMGARPIKHQWTDEAITSENIENAVTVLLNRGQETATVREIVEVIKQFNSAAFDATRKMVDYRHRVTKKFMSSDKKLLGRHSSKFVKGQYVFNIK